MQQRDQIQSDASQHAVAPRNAALASVDASRVDRPTPTRRGFLQVSGGIILSSLTGCAGWRVGRQMKGELAPNLPMSDLVSHLNANTNQIDSWYCSRVGVGAEGEMMPNVTLSADIAIERPRNFRLVAKALTAVIVDLGSNDERFWFWDKSQNMMLTARHDRIAAAQQQLPLPFEPDWLIEALGVIPLDESEIEFEKDSTHSQRVFFKRQRKAPDGTPVEIVSTVDSSLGVILEHNLIDQRGKVIACAKMGEHARDPKTKIVQAHSVSLSWPAAKLKLNMRFGPIDTNPKTLSRELFKMPDKKCEVVDIGGDGDATERVSLEAPEPRAPRRGKSRL
jgi:hypothetical protein